jgi:16S rRNA G966 N2-methylase RsmD
MAKKQKITNVKEYHKNPRHITDDRKRELEKNMLELGDISGIVHDLNTGEIISGNQRSKIINLEECEVVISEKYKEPTKQGTVAIGHVIWQEQKFNYRAVRWNDAQREKANITANALTGYWSHEILAEEWQDVDLLKWGIPEQDVKALQVKESKKQEAHRKLTERFIVPPFSVLDSRKGYWMQRKKAWKEIIQDQGESREGTLSKGDNIINNINDGVSILDPVMAELVSYWYGIEGGNAFDTFAGDTVFGYVAASYKMKFKGIELRKEQADINNRRVKAAGLNAKYVCDDGQNVAKHFKPNSQDLYFSCPPYFDLEVYSELDNDASNQASYTEFLQILDNSFAGAYKALKENRFAVIVVGDIRDKKDAYRLFVDDIRRMWNSYGAILYNEMIYVEPVGTLPQRVGRFMKNRKVGKCHQNILVFYKGDPKEIKNTYKELEYDSEDMELFGLD